MSFLGKTYIFVKNENLDALLRAQGEPEDKIAAVLAEKPTSKIEKNGDTYSLTHTTSTGPKVTNFKSGVEFDDVVGKNTPVKTSITVDGNVITQHIKSSYGNEVIKIEFNGDELVSTITSDKYDGVAIRYYKAN